MPDEWFSNDANGRKAAERLANLYINDDPCPDIPASLLGSPAIVEYVRKTGMIFPFRGFDRDAKEFKKSLIKTASYEIGLGGPYYRYNDHNGNLTEIAVDGQSTPESHICFPANSIVFISTNEEFFLPNFIAMRFNLRIKHVHRGLLLGTGPMVDPGYRGKLLIPVHNLTDSDYYIQADEGLIWTEFTKTYPFPAGVENQAADDLYRSSKLGLPKLPKSTTKELREYLFNANNGLPIRSSIPQEIERAISTANKAEERSEKAENRIRNIGLVAIIGLLIAAAGLFFPVLNMLQDLHKEIDVLRERIILNEAQPPENEDE